MTKWKVGDLCKVEGEGDEIFVVREAPSDEFPNSAYLQDITTKGVTGHGRESLAKLRRLNSAEVKSAAQRHQRALRWLTAPSRP